MPRYQFTTADRRKGFRNAVAAIQERYCLDFNDAVQYMMRRISPGGDWVSVRETRKIQEERR